MGFKCALQIKGLTIDDPAPTAKHRMNLRKAVMEAGNERASKSDTLDRSRSHFNRYEGFTSGKECADAMETGSEFTTVHMKDGTVRQRKTRSDAVIGFAVICNPPADVCQSWDDDTYAKFYSDSWECLSLVKPNIFRDENTVMIAEHFDEGVPPEDSSDVSQIDRHQHRIGYARDENGKWCGNEIDGKFLHDLNTVFPQMMRDRGWDMDELDTTDYDRMAVDEEYATERRKKRKQSGKSVNEHIAGKVRDADRQATELVNQALQISTAATERMNLAAELMMEADAQKQYADKVVDEAEAKAKHLLENATAQAKQVEQKASAANDEVQELEIKRTTLSKTIEAQQQQIQEWENAAEQQREAIMPTAAGSAEFVLNMLMRSKQYKDDDDAQEYLMQFISIIRRFKSQFNQRQEDWRKKMRERRHADKQASGFARKEVEEGYEIE